MLDVTIPGLPPIDADESVWNMSCEFREDYVAMKYDVADEYKPRTICEIGVYSGISALCFLAACPTAEYTGIDDLSAEQSRGIEVVTHTVDTLLALSYKVRVIYKDSGEIQRLPGKYDMVHVDGSHFYPHKRHDVWLGWEALNPRGILLVDNGHDPFIVAALFAQLKEGGRNVLDWRYDPRSVGQIIVRKP